MTDREPTLAEQIELMNSQFCSMIQQDSPYQKAILASLRRLQAIEQAEGMPDEPMIIKIWRGAPEKTVPQQEVIAYIDALRACAMRWKADGERLDWLQIQDGRFYNIDKITAIGGKPFNVRAAIDAEIAKGRVGK